MRDLPPRPDSRFVLYWMTAFRRTRSNFALERAVQWANSLALPLIVHEPLRCDYKWAAIRHHRFILDGMAANSRALAGTQATYYPYVETHRGAGKGLLHALSQEAAVVIADDWPGFFHPAMLAAAARQVECRMEAVDSNGLIPLRSMDRAFLTAYAFRRYLQRVLLDELARAPHSHPISELLTNAVSIPTAVLERWPLATDRFLTAAALGADTALPLDHTVAPVDVTGGSIAATSNLDAFLDNKLHMYAESRSMTDVDASSGLSPWIHYGHISTHEIFARIVEHESWIPPWPAPKAVGKRSGWWGMSANAESFLDELITWRELSLNGAEYIPGYDQYSSLPDWAKATLSAHSSDRRANVYTEAELDNSATHDPLWNAAQRQLKREGIIHNYLRMLWGKKVLEWSPTPEEGLDRLVKLNDRYAIDGRDPNSISGIFWCFGRYDRPWGPTRAIFGSVRYMSSDNTARKFNVKPYLARYRAG